MQQLAKTEARMWLEGVVTRDEMGLAYIRVSEKFHLSYSGWDEVQRYTSSRWPAEVERDLAHDVDTYKENGPERRGTRVF